MLILTRRPRETLFIGSEVAVTVLDIRGDRVRIGIEAPREIEVQREERLATASPAPPETASPLTAPPLTSRR